MSDIKLFRTTDGAAEELKGSSVALEKSIQNLIEQNLETILGVRFLATEYSTGKAHGGRIDTLGIDENGCPVIIEYKRAVNETVILQALYYLNWLMEHKAEFQLLVMRKYGVEQADTLEWGSPRLICIAGDFTKLDKHAVQQMNSYIDLIRYQRYGEDFLLLELIHSKSTQPIRGGGQSIPKSGMPARSVAPEAQPVQNESSSGSHIDALEKADDSLRALFEQLKHFLLALDGVQMKSLKSYIAFTHIKNVAYVKVFPTRFKGIVASVKIDYSDIGLEEGFTQLTSNGHIDIYIRDANELEKAKPLLLRSYEEN